MKLIKTRFKTKFDKVEQDIRIGRMLKRERVKILENILQEQNGNIILKINDSTEHKFKEFGKSKQVSANYEGLVEFLK